MSCSHVQDKSLDYGKKKKKAEGGNHEADGIIMVYNTINDDDE